MPCRASGRLCFRVCCQTDTVHEYPCLSGCVLHLHVSRSCDPGAVGFQRLLGTETRLTAHRHGTLVLKEACFPLTPATLSPVQSAEVHDRLVVEQLALIG